MEGFILGANISKLPEIGKLVGKPPEKAQKPAKILNLSNLRELLKNIRLENSEKWNAEQEKAQEVCVEDASRY